MSSSAHITPLVCDASKCSKFSLLSTDVLFFKAVNITVRLLFIHMKMYTCLPQLTSDMNDVDQAGMSVSLGVCLIRRGVCVNACLNLHLHKWQDPEFLPSIILHYGKMLNIIHLRGSFDAAARRICWFYCDEYVCVTHLPGPTVRDLSLSLSFYRNAHSRTHATASIHIPARSWREGHSVYPFIVLSGH